MISSTAAVSGATTLSSSTSPSTTPSTNGSHPPPPPPPPQQHRQHPQQQQQQQQQQQKCQEPQPRKGGNGKRRTTTTILGTISVYVLMACSALLLIRSSQLQSYRFKAALLKNNIGNKQQHSTRLVPVEGNQYYAPSLDYRIGAGISQYMNNPDNGTSFKEAHVYCDDGWEKEVLWDWWQPLSSRSLSSSRSVSRSLSRSGLRKNKKKKHKNKKNQNKKKDEDDKQKPKRSTRKRLLIGVSGGYDNSAKLLKQAVWSARVYGTIWEDVTVVTVQGTSFSPHGCKAVSTKYSTISKIQLLLTALELRRSEGSNEGYDRLLILDADTMIYDMDVDVTTLTQPTMITTTASSLSSEEGGRDNDDNANTNDNNFIVAGGPPIIIGKKDSGTRIDPWKNIDSSMLLWNLEHPDTPAIAREWYHYAQQAIIRGTYRNDQKYLHISVQKYCEQNQHNTNNEINDENSKDHRESCSAVRTFEHQEFSDETQGTIIQQFLSTTTSTTSATVPSTQTMPTNKSNNNTSTRTVSSSSPSSTTQLPSQSRLARMEETAERICLRYPHACQEVGTQPSPHYETTS